MLKPATCSPNLGYLLPDVIYPRCHEFSLPIHGSSPASRRRYMNKQELTRKGVERVSGSYRVSGLFSGESELWNIGVVVIVSDVCVIVHNLPRRMEQVGNLRGDDCGEAIKI